jgi:hypothetical protein
MAPGRLQIAIASRLASEEMTSGTRALDRRAFAFMVIVAIARRGRTADRNRPFRLLVRKGDFERRKRQTGSW